MIVTFNPDVFDSDSGEILESLSEVLTLLISDRHFVDVSNFRSVIFDDDENYVFDETKVSVDFLSKHDRNRVKGYFRGLIQNSAYITKVRKKYLTEIIIGLDNDEIDPKLAYEILSNSSKLVVENATNDWKFVRGVSAKYARHNKRKSIYSLIKRAIDEFWLEPEQAGGKGQIKLRIEDLRRNRYRDIYRYKLMAMFDSDRADAVSIDHEQKSIVEYLKGKAIKTYAEAVYEESDPVVWHMFYKREMENYVPQDVLVSDSRLATIQQSYLNALSPTELDFFRFETYLPEGGEINVKRDFPEFFLGDWTRDKLEFRCEHHKVHIELPNGTLEEMSEIEQILLKIARII